MQTKVDKQTILQLVAKVTKKSISEIHLQSNLIDLGVDSVRAVELLLEMEFSFDMEFDSKKFAECQTVQDILESF